MVAIADCVMHAAHTKVRPGESDLQVTGIKRSANAGGLVRSDRTSPP